MGGHEKNILEFNLLIPKISGILQSDSYLYKFYTFIVFLILHIGLASYVAQALDYKNEEMLVSIEALHWSVCFVTTIGCSSQMYYYTPNIIKIGQTVQKGFYNYGHDLTQKQKKIIEEGNNEVKNVIKLFVCVTCFACLFCLLKNPVFGGKINNPNSEVTWKLIYPAHFPFEIDTWFKYAMVTILQILLSISVLLQVSSFMIFFITLSRHLTGQYQVLQEEFHQVYIRCKETQKALNLSSKDYEDILYQELVKCVQHHQILIRYFEDMQNMLHFTLLTVVFNAAGILCTLVYMLMSATESDINVVFTYTAVMGTEFMLVYCYCAYGQKITDEASNLRIHVYDFPWYEHGNRIRYVIMFVLMRTKKPVVLTAYGLKSMSLMGFSETLQTSYTYFNMLYANGK